MADFSAPYNALLAANLAPQKNALAANLTDLAQTSTAISGAQSALAQADDAQLANAQNHLAFITNAMTPLLAKGANITQADVANAGADAVATSKGRISPQEISQFVSTLPQDGPGIQQALQQHQLRLLDAQRQIAAVRGDPVTYDTGAGLQFGTRNSFSGNFQPQQGPNASIEKSLTPEAATAPTQTGTNPDGTARIGTRRQFVQQATAGGGVTTGLPAGAGSAMEASGKAYAADQTAAADYRARVTPLENAIPLLEKLGPGYQGQVGQFKADIQRTYQAVTGSTPPDDPVKAYDELQKYLISEARSTGNSTTNDQLAAAIAGNPSTKISNAGATDVAKTALAIKRMKQAQIVSAQNEGVQPGAYLTRSANWNGAQDPRAYAFDLMSAPAQQSLIKSLGPKGSPAYQKFVTSLQSAHDAGVLNAPSGQ